MAELSISVTVHIPHADRSKYTPLFSWLVNHGWMGFEIEPVMAGLNRDNTLDVSFRGDVDDLEELADVLRGVE